MENMKRLCFFRFPKLSDIVLLGRWEFGVKLSEEVGRWEEPRGRRAEDLVKSCSPHWVGSNPLLPLADTNLHFENSLRDPSVSLFLLAPSKPSLSAA